MAENCTFGASDECDWKVESVEVVCEQPKLLDSLYGNCRFSESSAPWYNKDYTIATCNQHEAVRFAVTDNL